MDRPHSALVNKAPMENINEDKYHTQPAPSQHREVRRNAGPSKTGQAQL